jgi:uncharacterized protein (DUF4415 family)
MPKKPPKKIILHGLDKEGVPDEENPEWTEETFRNAVYGLDGLASLVGEEAVAPLRKKAGRPKSPTPKRNGTLRLTGDIWDRLKASGHGYNVRVEAVLREALEQGRI